MVHCLECGEEKKLLAPHIAAKHYMNVKAYKEKYGQDADVGWTIADISASVRKSPKRKKTKTSIKTISQPIFSGLSPEEQEQYDQQVALLFEQSSRDPVLLPMIRDIAMNQIFITRYQLQINQLSNKYSSGAEAKIAIELHKLIQVMQKTNLENMDSLNLTKAKKDSLNKTPESTPSKVVSAFAYAIKTMTQEERQKNQKDMDEAMLRLRHNLDSLLTLVDSLGGEAAEEIEPVATE